LIGGNECEIQDIDSVSLTCLTPTEETSDATLWPGNAGLKYQLWLDAEIDISLNMTLDILSGLLIFIEIFGPRANIRIGSMNYYSFCPSLGIARDANSLAIFIPRGFWKSGNGNLSFLGDWGN
jgi:hypothetical protein